MAADATPGAPVGRHAALLLAALLALPALAQTPAAPPPQTQDIIDALRPAASRLTRNLLVRQTSPAASAPTAASPSSPPPQTVAAPPAVAPGAAPAPVAAPVATAIAATPAPAARPPAPTSAPAEAAPSLSLAIQFELNSSRVRPESGPVLGNLVAAMLSPDLKDSRFVIEGHTDARGNPAANQQLSQQRADEVRLFLVALGVHPARLKAVGKGSSQLARPADPLSADNRRVRVVTLE
jgi:outer membrane protein OmpA-like peptidoglycan-associated protein